MQQSYRSHWCLFASMLERWLCKPRTVTQAWLSGAHSQKQATEERMLSQELLRDLPTRHGMARQGQV